MMRSGVRVLALGVAALALLVDVSAARTSAAPAMKTYTDTTLHSSLKYPATWSLQKATIHAFGKSLGMTAGVNLAPPDQLVGFTLAVKPSATSLATMKADITALVSHGITVAGKMNVSTKTSGAYPQVMVTATGQLDASHTAKVIAVITTNGKTTFFLVNYIMTKPAAPKAEINQLGAVDDSLTDI